MTMTDAKALHSAIHWARLNHPCTTEMAALILAAEAQLEVIRSAPKMALHTAGALTQPKAHEAGMIERVAAALYDLEYRAPSGHQIDTWDGGTPNAREYWIAAACGAIEAMREPTEAMVDAGDAALPHPAWAHEHAETVGTWSAMISAALAEPHLPPAPKGGGE